MLYAVAAMLLAAAGAIALLVRKPHKKSKKNPVKMTYFDIFNETVYTLPPLRAFEARPRRSSLRGFFCIRKGFSPPKASSCGKFIFRRKMAIAL